MKNRKIRFVILLTTLLLVGFITTSFVSYYVAHDSLSKNIEETTLPLTSDNIYSEIQQDLLRPIFISSLMARDTFLRDWTIEGEKDETAIVRYLKEIQTLYGTVTSFFVSDKTRKYYHPSGIVKKVSIGDPQDEWYYRVRRMTKDYEINIDTDTADKDSLNVFINYRVYDYKGDFIGVTGVGLTVKAVKDLINTYQSRYGRRVYFVDREGMITLTSSSYTGPKTIRDIPGLKNHATRLLTSPSCSINYEHDGKTVYLNSRLVQDFGWYLLVEQVDDPATTRIEHTLWSNLAISLIISVVILALASLTIGTYQKKLEEMAMTDKLTGVANRQMFEMIFEQTRKLSKRRKEDLSVAMFDIDHFKHVNDTYGHDAGDFALQSIADTVKKHLRETDVLCRWGGEEFIILLPGCSCDQAALVAEKVRHDIEKKAVKWNNTALLITASFGVAELTSKEEELDLINRADKALYSAKENGRNRVEKA